MKTSKHKSKLRFATHFGARNGSKRCVAEFTRTPEKDFSVEEVAVAGRRLAPAATDLPTSLPLVHCVGIAEAKGSDTQ